MLSVKYFIILQMLKFAIFAVIALPSIRVALSRREMALALIVVDDAGTLEGTFKKYEKEQNQFKLSYALA